MLLHARRWQGGPSIFPAFVLWCFQIPSLDVGAAALVARYRAELPFLQTSGDTDIAGFHRAAGPMLQMLAEASGRLLLISPSNGA